MKYCIILSLMLMFSFDLSAQSNKNERMNNKVIDAKILWEAFSEDNDKALKLYSGRHIIIGYASYVGPDPYALPPVEVTDKKGGKSMVMCVLPFSDYLKLRKVEKGDAVRIEGDVRGFWEKGKQVIVKECKIL